MAETVQSALGAMEMAQQGMPPKNLSQTTLISSISNSNNNSSSHPHKCALETIVIHLKVFERPLLLTPLNICNKLLLALMLQVCSLHLLR